LEDFIPFADTTAVQTFYDYLRWINGPESVLETSDCALRPPRPHNDPHSAAKLSIHGRVFILYRNLHLNSLKEQSNWLCGKLMQILAATDPALTAAEGVVGFTKNPSLQKAISNGRSIGTAFQATGPNDPGFGEHLMLSFWAYGDNDAAVFGSLQRVFTNVWTACRQISAEIEAALAPAPNTLRQSPPEIPPIQQ